MYYENTLKAIKRRMGEEYGVITASHTRDDSRIHEYVLWMIEEIEVMDTTSLSTALKAGRWLGWILCMVEERLAWWPNQYSRDIVRVDVTSGRDQPH